MAMMRATFRWVKARLCTGSLVFVLCLVAWFAISASYHSLHRSSGAGLEDEDQPRSFGDRRLAGLNKEDYLGSRRVDSRGGVADGYDDEEVQFCKYPLNIDSDVATSDVWSKSSEPETCDQRMENLFYIEKGDLLAYGNVENRIERCEYRGIDWASDTEFVYTEAHIRTAPSSFDVKFFHDFIHVQCYTSHTKSRSTDDKPIEPESEGELPVDGDDQQKEGHPEQHQHHGLRKKRRLNDDDNNNNNNRTGHPKFQFRDVKDFHRSVLHKNAPRLYGSIGLPDLSDSFLRQRLSDPSKDQPNVDSRRLLGAVESHQSDHHDEGEELEVTNTEEKQKNVIDGDLEDLPDDRRKTWNDPRSGSEARHNPDVIDSDTGLKNSGSPSFDQFLVQVSEKDEVKERATKLAVEGLGMNVLILALDSISRASFEENFKESSHYLQTELNSVAMYGFNSLGDAATAFVIPLLTGFKEDEVTEIKRSGNLGRYVNLLSFIWNKFEQKGYATLYAEDEPDLGTFQTHYYGFEDVPVDHYMRPFWLAASRSQLQSKGHKNCLGSNPKYKYTFDYITDFFRKYESIPKFAFGFLSEFNRTKLIDEDLKVFLEQLKREGHLDNTLLVVVGDHGQSYGDNRATLAGKLEESLPYLSLAFPAEFRQSHGQLMANVQKNGDRLVTALDLHTTLTNLLDIDSAKIPVNSSSRSISLLQEIPKQRTCSTASIDMHWCSCVKYERLKDSDQTGNGNDGKSIALQAIRHINALVKNEDEDQLCADVALKTVLDVRAVFPNEVVFDLESKLTAEQTEVANLSRRYPLSVRHRQVLFKTSPNDAVFEATIDSAPSSSSLSSSPGGPPAVSRINAYGRQSDCVLRTHPDLRKYCQCLRPEDA